MTFGIADSHSPGNGRKLALEVVEGDITTFAADLVAFKYAQRFYGADMLAARELEEVGIHRDELELEIGEHRLIDPGTALGARQALFIGVQPLQRFGYEKIREFGATVIRILRESVPDCRHLALTLHGPGYGLDEIEALLSMLSGCMEAIADRPAPNLERISVVEKDSARAGRLSRALQGASHHGGGQSVTEGARGWLVELEGPTGLESANSQQLAELPGAGSDRKAHVFVAMPFADEFSDLFEYGIQRPVRELGFLCERIDQEIFTGDILERIKTQIESAIAVIAVLTGANPNVYLEVGYAWGKNRPVILISKEDPKFDLRGQRWLKYSRIREVEDTLRREVAELWKS